MRFDPPGSRIQGRHRDPRIVVAIIYPTGSLYFTNRTAIANVPGSVVQGVLKDISSTSQTLYPDEGRATIGSLAFSVVDVDEAVSALIRSQLLSQGYGVRLREVRVFTGDVDDFTKLVRVETYVIDDVVEYSGRSYRFSCSDRNRELRESIFLQVGTRLAAPLSDGATDLTVLSTVGFNRLQHTAAFTDAPSQLVGYVRIRKTGEIISYTSTDSTHFLTCTRGCFGTVPQAVEIAAGTATEQLPEIEEFIYLEMPGPQLRYALLTGKIRGTSITLPATWHLGIDEANVNGALFDQIGRDLFDPDDHTAGFVLRFTHLEETDGKRFIEEQIDVPLGTFGPIDANGKLGLRRRASLLGTSSAVAATLDASNIIAVGAVRYLQRKLINQVNISWNYNGERHTRLSVFINAASIATHFEAKPRDYEWAGLWVERHSVAMIQERAQSIFDAYAAPPIELELTLSRVCNGLEIGDTAFVKLPRIPDYTAAGSLDRVFEVQSRSINWRTGDLKVKLFGSTARARPNVGIGTSAVLLSAWYTASGTNLTSALTIVGGHVTTNGALTGNVDGELAVYYYVGDLTIDTGVTVAISQNVRLYIRGKLTVNGKIDGKGNGLAGLTDTNVVSSPWVGYPESQIVDCFIGGTLPQSGIYYSTAPISWHSLGGHMQRGTNVSFPQLALEVVEGDLRGLPKDLRGARGAYGPPVVEGPANTVRALGGGGGAGGAGLLIVTSGGLFFGASGVIDLSGANGSNPGATGTVGGVVCYGGGGAGGAPGALLVVLDGDALPYPDVLAKFLASQGSSPFLGTKLTEPFVLSAPPAPATGYWVGYPAADHWEAHHKVQYVPSNATLGASEDDGVPAPTGFEVVPDSLGVRLQWVPPADDKYSYVEVWESIDNDRSNALPIAQVRGDNWFRNSDAPLTRYYWVRSFRHGFGRSAFVPAGSTEGLSATFGGALGQSQWTPALSAEMQRNGNTFTKLGASSAWDASVSSQEGYPAAWTSFRVGDLGKSLIIGFAANPSIDDNYTSIDVALFYNALDQHAYAGRFGSFTDDLGVVTTADTLSITYDGTKAEFLVNNAVRAILPQVGLAPYLDSSFKDPGAFVNGLAFGPYASVLANAIGWGADAEGKPAGVRAIEGIADRSQLTLVGGKLRITSTPDATVGYGLGAIPINDTKRYQFTIRHSSSAASATGLYLRFAEYIGATLPSGKTHVGHAATGEVVVVDRNTVVDVVANGAMPGAAVEQTFTYTPTPGTRFASLSFYNYNAAAAGVSYDVEWVALTVLGSSVNLLPGVSPLLDTFGLNAAAATELFVLYDESGVVYSNMA